jgi:hypothetical protein
MFSDRSRENSISSGVTTLVPVPLSLPAAAALTQLRRVWSVRPKSLATAPAVCPDFTRLTASSLNSAVYSRFAIFFIFPSPKLTSIIRHPWKTKFRGKVISGIA